MRQISNEELHAIKHYKEEVAKRVKHLIEKLPQDRQVLFMVLAEMEFEYIDALKGFNAYAEAEAKYFKAEVENGKRTL
jgi:hypothetical protein